MSQDDESGFAQSEPASEPVDLAITLEEFAAQCFLRGDASGDGLYPVDLEKMQQAFIRAHEKYVDASERETFYCVGAKYLAAEGFRLGNVPGFDQASYDKGYNEAMDVTGPADWKDRK